MNQIESNPDYADLYSLILCVGHNCNETWCDDFCLEALSHSRIEVRDAAAQILDIHSRYDLLSKHQEKVPWLRNYIEEIMKESSGEKH